jgi:2-polyprenyl-3-methyl-5-hydroxy-6-metoxy-1,4-benzoquinol methylase
MRKQSRDSILEPVAAYDRIASEFGLLTAERMPYLDAVDRLVVSDAPRDCRSLLDVGAGDGRRGLKIARACGVEQPVLLEPSAAMCEMCPSDATILQMRAELLSSLEGEFDLITCLWNVLGHIFPAASRVDVLRQLARLVSPQGRVFMDVSHRYNARHYGSLATAGRFLLDRVWPAESHGDVVVTWHQQGRRCSTRGHVFTAREVRSLCRKAGLVIESRLVVDYSTGELRRWSVGGNLFYVLRRSTSAP